MVSLSKRVLWSTAPAKFAAFGHAPPVEVIALRSVMSTASCAPFCNGNLDARTSMALASKTEIPSTFMFLNFTLVLTMAFASWHTLASIFSVGSALARTRPDLGHALRCLPNVSWCPPHSHRASVMCSGNRRRSNSRVRNNSGISWNSGPVGGSKQHLSCSWIRMRAQMGLVRRS